jgi:hypothetical protein
MSASPSPNPNAEMMENSRVKWAWSMDRQQPMDDPAVYSPRRSGIASVVEGSSVRMDLMDVIRLISTSTVQTQTMEPSYTMSLTNVKMESEVSRSIAVQCGHRMKQENSSMQVVEADIAADGVEHRDAFGNVDDDDDPMLTVGPVTSMHSAYLPNCNVPASLYPVFMSDARALGICNRYGYVALPKPPVELPPRRRVKAISPMDYPHLYGSHNPALDEHTGRQLHRAHGLWTSQCGFVPKY